MDPRLLATTALDLCTLFLQIAAVLVNCSVLCCCYGCGSGSGRRPSSRFVLSLTLAHLSLSSVGLLHSTLPHALLPIISSGAWTEAVNLLKTINVYSTLIVSMGSPLTLALISTERYLTIAHPMRYKSWLTKGVCSGALAVAWVGSFTTVLLGPPLLFEVVNFDGGDDETTSSSNWLTSTELTMYYALLLSSITAIVLSVMLVCYGAIFRIALAKCARRVQIGKLAPEIIGQKPRGSVSSISSDSSYSSSQSVEEGLLAPAVHNHCLAVSSPKGEGQQRRKDPSSSGLEAQTRQPAVSRVATCYEKGEVLSTRRKSLTRWFFPRRPSPRRTVTTILLLVGSFVLSQVPLCAWLFWNAMAADTSALLQSAIILLLTTSSVSTPLLYGGVLSRRGRAGRSEKRRAQSPPVVVAGQSQKVGVPPPSHPHFTRAAAEPIRISIMLDERQKCPGPVATALQEDLGFGDVDEGDGELLAVSVSPSRKASRDSGTELRFSDEGSDSEEEERMQSDEEVPHSGIC